MVSICNILFQVVEPLATGKTFFNVSMVRMGMGEAKLAALEVLANT